MLATLSCLLARGIIYQTEPKERTFRVRGEVFVTE
jgi:hypothetical protein